jgi:hypothetical protein
MKRVENWEHFASGQHELYWLCSFDVDDPTMRDPAVQLWCQQRGLHYYYGTSKTKVQAINADLDRRPPDYDVAIIVSDDMAVIAPGWDEIVAFDMRQHFPQLDGALWYLDGRRDDLCTLSIMGRGVLERLGYLYSPEYATSYCDNDYQRLMEHQGKLWRCGGQVFRHEWRVENNDALMRRNEGRELYARDKATFERRMRDLTANALPELSRA